MEREKVLRLVRPELFDGLPIATRSAFVGAHFLPRLMQVLKREDFVVQRVQLPFPGPPLSCGSSGAAWPGAVIFGRGCRVASLREIEGNLQHHSPYSSIGTSLAHLRVLPHRTMSWHLPGRLRSLGHRLPGAPPQGGIASVSWGLIATMNRSDSLPGQGLRLLSLSRWLPGSAAGYPGLGKASLGHALIRSHRASSQIPDGLPCRASPSPASSPTRPAV